jgi:hypothetical protein
VPFQLIPTSGDAGQPSPPVEDEDDDAPPPWPEELLAELELLVVELVPPPWPEEPLAELELLAAEAVPSPEELLVEEVVLAAPEPPVDDAPLAPAPDEVSVDLPPCPDELVVALAAAVVKPPCPDEGAALGPAGCVDVGLGSPSSRIVDVHPAERAATTNQGPACRTLLCIFATFCRSNVSPTTQSSSAVRPTASGASGPRAAFNDDRPYLAPPARASIHRRVGRSWRFPRARAVARPRPRAPPRRSRASCALG